MEPAPEKFADSAKNADRTYFENEALDQATKTLFQILDDEPPKLGPVKPGLAKLLREVQTQQLFAGERDEDGRRVLKSFEEWVKMCRRLYVRHGSGSTGDKYKHVTEALTNNRLEDASLSPLPAIRSVLQKLSTVELELQVRAWDRTLKDADGKEITPKHVALAAVSVGSECVTIPSPTASSKMPEIRKEWAETKLGLVKEFGPSTERHFTRLDDLLLKKNGKAQSMAHGVAAERGRLDNSANEGPHQEDSDAPAPRDVDAPAVPEVVESTADNQNAPQNIATTDGDKRQTGKVDDLAVKTPDETLPSKEQNLAADDHPAGAVISTPVNPLLRARVWQDDTGLMVGFASKNHKAAVQAKVNSWHLGYRWDDDKRYWRRRIISVDERQAAYREIISKFSNAGVVIDPA